MMKRMIVVSMLLFLLVGCGGTKLYVNGAPAPGHISMLTNPETGMKAYYAATVHYPRKEGKETVAWFHYVPFNSIVKLPKETTALVIALRLANESKVEYSLWEKYSSTYVNGSNPYYIEHQLYSGSLSLNNFQIPCPINVVEGTYSLEVRDKKGRPMFYIGNLVYTHKKGGN
jgi:hypothetical protein